jgi:hypothetical protein
MCGTKLIIAQSEPPFLCQSAQRAPCVSTSIPSLLWGGSVAHPCPYRVELVVSRHICQSAPTNQRSESAPAHTGSVLAQKPRVDAVFFLHVAEKDAQNSLSKPFLCSLAACGCLGQQSLLKTEPYVWLQSIFQFLQHQQKLGVRP